MHPSFRGAMPPDVSFFGFDLTVEDVVGRRRSPTSRRRLSTLGTSSSSRSSRASRDSASMWTRRSASGDSPAQVSGGPPAGMPLNGLEWGRNAAHMAGITRQQPVRIAIHASQFVPKPSDGRPDQLSMRAHVDVVMHTALGTERGSAKAESRLGVVRLQRAGSGLGLRGCTSTDRCRRCRCRRIAMTEFR